MKIAVIIPTYNEAGGIAAVLDELAAACTKKPEHQWLALIVDGNSSDGTRNIVRNKHYASLEVHLLEEQKKSGIGQAYVSGITHAITQLKVDVFAEFDGDGQHNPLDLLLMVDALENGADYVIGSRYVTGGSVSKEWAAYRKLLSRFGSLFARIILELPVHDVTSGLRLTRVRGFIEHLPHHPSALISSDYAYKIHFLLLMTEAGARIKEVPIIFRERQNDTSKSTSRDIIESLRVVTLLRWKRLKSWRLLRVVAVGGFGFLIQAAIFEFFGIQTQLLSPSTAAVVGGEGAILSNFLLNEKFSFYDRLERASFSFSRLARFHLVSFGSIVVQWSFLSVTEQITSEPTTLRLVFILALIIGFLVNYTGYYFFVWHQRNTSS